MNRSLRNRVVGRTRWARALAGTAIVVAAAIALPSTATFAAPAFTFDVFMNSQCVSGTGPANDSITLTLKNRNGVVVDQRHATTNSSGALSMTSCFKRGVTGLDHIRAGDGSVSREFVVPDLTINVNRVTDVVSGRAPAGHNVTFTGCHYAVFLTCEEISGDATANANGTYSEDFTPTVNIRGEDFVQVEYSSPAGDSVQREGFAPKVVVTVGDAYVLGYANPGRSISVRLKRSGSVMGTGADVADSASGYWSDTLRRSGGNPIAPHAGDTIAGTWAGDGALTIPTTSVTGNAATDHITGQCLVDKPVKVRAYHPDFSATSWAAGMANGTGHFDVDMSNTENPAYDLQHGDVIEVSCLTARGDTVFFTGAVP